MTSTATYTAFSRRNLLLGVFMALAFACTTSAGAANISPEQLSTALQSKNFLLVDVRTPAEHQRGMIPGTDFLISHDSIVGQWDTKAIAKDKPIVLYCHSGARSSAAARTLKAMGYTNVRDLSGGIMAWSRSGHNVIKP